MSGRDGNRDYQEDSDDDVFEADGNQVSREWQDDECPGELGDIIEFDRKTYLHYGVNVGRQHVAHLTGDGPVGWISYITSASHQAVIKVERFSKVARGSQLARVSNKHDTAYAPYEASTVANRAIASVGGRGYHLLFHNCEHFANWCRYGVRLSHQAQILGMGTTALCGALVGSIAGPVGTAAGAAGGALFAVCSSVAWRRFRYRQTRQAKQLGHSGCSALFSRSLHTQ